MKFSEVLIHNTNKTQENNKINVKIDAEKFSSTDEQMTRN